MNDLAEATVYRANGTVEVHQVGRHILLDWSRRMIGASSLDVVSLKDGMVMVVDDTGMIDNKPVNPLATTLYWLGVNRLTGHPICGDAVVARDADFGE